MRRTAIITVIAIMSTLVIGVMPASAKKKDFGMNTGGAHIAAGCVKFEAGDTGTKTNPDTGLTVTVDGWTKHRGEYEDVSFTSDYPVMPTVKAGQYVGFLGTQQKSISNIVFCLDDFQT